MDGAGRGGEEQEIDAEGHGGGDAVTAVCRSDTQEKEEVRA